MSGIMTRDKATPEGFINACEAAQKLHIKPLYLCILCVSGKIAGAINIGVKWYIPVDVVEQLQHIMSREVV